MIKQYIAIAVIIIAIAALCLLGFRACVKESGVAEAPDEQVTETRAVIDSIRSIGQWELTSIDMNVEVDTMQKRWLGLVKDNLRRRYYGTLSIGIDMAAAAPDCYRPANADTVYVTLPDVALLDTNFIDESQTEILSSQNDDFERNSQVKKEMLARARHKMMSAATSDTTLVRCRQRATDALTRRLQGIGYKAVIVRFTPNGKQQE